MKPPCHAPQIPIHGREPSSENRAVSPWLPTSQENNVQRTVPGNGICLSRAFRNKALWTRELRKWREEPNMWQRLCRAYVCKARIVQIHSPSIPDFPLTLLPRKFLLINAGLKGRRSYPHTFSKRQQTTARVHWKARDGFCSKTHKKSFWKEKPIPPSRFLADDRDDT